MVFFQFADRVRLPMIVLLNKDGKLDAPATFGMKSRPEDYKAEIRSRLNKLLTAAATVREPARDEAVERAMTNATAPAATLSQRKKQ
jgi:hypothetical protein